MVLALSPDEQSVLLVHEYGHWKPPGGAVEPGKSFLETAIRELKEEVDVDVDLVGYAPRCLGGYHQPRSRDGIVNDNLKCLALRACSTVFTPDMQEVHRAKWVILSHFWHHPLVLLIFYLQFPIAELAAVAELHLHSDAHFDGTDGANLIHEQERCLQCSPVNISTISSHAVSQVLLALFAVGADARSRQVHIQTRTCNNAAMPRRVTESLSFSRRLFLPFLESTPGASAAERFKKKSKWQYSGAEC